MRFHKSASILLALILILFSKVEIVNFWTEQKNIDP